MKRLFLFIALYLFTLSGLAETHQTLKVSSESGHFPLYSKNRAATVVVAQGEPITVRRVATLFADDVERVTGCRPSVSSKGDKGAVIIATIGHNAYVDGLIKKGRLDVSSIRGGWEQFVIREVDGRLIIVGSDRRGAAYGVFTLSEKMGVSPWYWWADVPVSHRDAVYVEADYASSEPSVKYRGIFINDEDSKVCELLLRLKANMLAPAMHSCTGAFYSHAESKVVCDSFGIIITTSHCEPLLLNNAAKSEWDSERDGEWNYKTNRETIWKKWDDRLREASQYENIYTVAMRGVHDEGLRGHLPMEERVPLIEKVIKEQRELLVQHKAFTPLAQREGQGGESSIPQIFVPYKETMDIYENGLRVPDDITLVWVDDNYGYMKRVANPEEQKRSGRSGVYYHLSYLGAPHDYLWLNTTPPVLMYEELKKAYDCGADRYWLLNVGDIKPMELGMQTFFDLAWNIGAFDFEKVYRHQAEFLARTLTLHSSKNLAKPDSSLFTLHSSLFQAILDDYYRLAWSRKPEFMGWEYEWDDKAHTGLKDTEFSFRNYDEAHRRLADYQRISDKVERISKDMRVVSGSPADSAAFFQLLQFPVQAAYQMNRKFLMAQLNHEMAAEGRYAEANWAARQMEEAYDSINALNRRYNKQLGGKWDGMMALSTSFTPTCQYYQKPEVKRFEGAGEQAVALSPLRGQKPKDCQVLDLSKFRHQGRSEGVRLIKGLGYDGHVLQFGDPTKAPEGGKYESIEYRFHAPSDTVDIIIYAVPFWPLYEGKQNRIVVSINNQPKQVFENKFKEYDRTWKDQVMRNGIMCRLRFAVDQIDWGGLQPSYIGPGI